MQDRDPFAVENMEAMYRHEDDEDAAQEIGFNKININCRTRMAIRERSSVADRARPR